MKTENYIYIKLCISNKAIYKCIFLSLNFMFFTLTISHLKIQRKNKSRYVEKIK